MRHLFILLIIGILALAGPARAQRTQDLSWVSTATGTAVITATATMTASTADTSDVFCVNAFRDTTALITTYSNDDTTKAKVEIQRAVYDDAGDTYWYQLTPAPVDSLTSGHHVAAKKNPQATPIHFAIKGPGCYRVIVTHGSGVGTDSDNAGALTAPYIDTEVRTTN